MKTLYRIFVILLIGSFLIASCAPAATQPPATAVPPTAVPTSATPAGKVTIWYDSGAAWNDFIAAFNKEMTNQFKDIQVEWVPQDAAQLSAKLVSAFAAKQGPDIAMGSQYRLMAAEQQFQAWEDLAPRVTADAEMKAIVDALPKIHVDSYTTKGKVWGLPQVVQAVGLFIRKSWMTKLNAAVPTDWTEMTALAERFTKEDPDGNGKADTIGYCTFGAPGITNSAGIQFEYTGAAAGMDYPIIDQNGKPSFFTDTGKKVAQYLSDWQHKNKITSPDTPTFTHKEFYEVVQAGKCGIGRIGAWNIGSWAKSAIAEDYVVIPYPPMTKGGKTSQVTWSNGIVMSATSANKDATYVVFKALMSKWGQTMFYQKLTSSSRTDLDWATLAKSENLLYFTKVQPSYVLEQAGVDTFNPILDILSKHLNKILADPSADPVAELQAADTEAQAKYKELRP